MDSDEKSEIKKKERRLKNRKSSRGHKVGVEEGKGKTTVLLSAQG